MEIRTGLLATLYLWLALHAHRYMRVDAAFATIARHANEACKILKSMVHQTPRLSADQLSPGKAKPLKESRVAAKKPTKRGVTMSRARSGIPRTTRTTRAQPAEPPVTPKPRRGVLL